ncbi:MAG: hypothetical protein RUMPE_00875 [Eubacteriales bacterium SKADARSKE-1]|nr:hypothetical protein [Eubacteriales bacterium SKADARSKE-1]
MNLNVMEYKNYVWPHNPQKINITTKRNIKEIVVPFSGNVFQDYGREKCIVTGTGEFFGINCMEQFNLLFNVFKESGNGYLRLPDINPFLAVFKSLEIIGQAIPNVITYSFEFWEEVNSILETANEAINYHVISIGETLWDIAAKYNIDIETLVSLNPTIKNINQLLAGERVELA